MCCHGNRPTAVPIATSARGWPCVCLTPITPALAGCLHCGHVTAAVAGDQSLISTWLRLSSNTAGECEGGTRDVHEWAVTDWNHFYCFSTVQHLTLYVPHLNKCLKMIRENNNSPVIDLLFVHFFDRKLYFAQHTISPYPSRVCDGPPGCVFSSGPDGPTQGSFYAPLPAGTCVSLNVFEVVRII